MTAVIVVEGKTKILFSTGREGILKVRHKSDITSGDGEKHEVLTGKDVAACQTTVNVFRLLEGAGIPTHFLEPEESEQLEENEMLVQACNMVKLEVVGRRVATGSYLKRSPQVVEGTRFVPLVTETFLKDDSRHDPLVEYDPSVQSWVLWDAGQPKNQQQPKLLETDFHLISGLDHMGEVVVEKLPEMRSILVDVFEVLEEAWHRLGVQLVDLKIEFGFAKDGTLVVADVIDNDSWRIWPSGDKRLQLDKQVFRELDEATAEEMGKIRQNYQRVAELTSQWRT